MDIESSQNRPSDLSWAVHFVWVWGWCLGFGILFGFGVWGQRLGDQKTGRMSRV